MLTGSASKGKYNHYYYYHCIASCGCRFRTDNANNLFIRELGKYIPKPEISNLFVTVIEELYYEKNKGQQSEQRLFLLQIEELNTRMRNARELFADQKIDADDFRELKKDCTGKIILLEAKLAGCSNTEKNIDRLLQKEISNLCSLKSLYESGTVTQKRQIISSIFLEKLTFDGFQYRTLRLNEGVRLIYTLDMGFVEMKNRKNNEFSYLFGGVVPTRIELVSKV